MRGNNRYPDQYNRGGSGDARYAHNNAHSNQNIHYNKHQNSQYHGQGQMQGHGQGIPTYQVTSEDVHQHYQQQMGALRQQVQHNHHQAPADMYPISEVVPVPDTLTSWAVGGQIQSVLLKVKERTGVGYMTSETDGNGNVSVLIHATSQDSARTARILLEIHFKEQIKFMSDMARLNKMQENLFEVQGEVASGQRIEFHIPVDLIGVSIGKGGGRIKEVTAKTGVHNISIDGKSGLVEISGPSPASVQAAKEEMDVVQENVELTKEEAVSMLRDYSYLNDLKDMSKCIVVRIPAQDNCVILVGTHGAVTSAKLILETQKDYISKRMQVKESETTIRDQLRTLDRSAGRGGGGGSGGRPRNMGGRNNNANGNTGNRSNGTGGDKSNTPGDSLQNLNKSKPSDNKESSDSASASSTTAPVNNKKKSAAPREKESANKANTTKSSESSASAKATTGNQTAKSSKTDSASKTATSSASTTPADDLDTKMSNMTLNSEGTKPKKKSKKKSSAANTSTTADTPPAKTSGATTTNSKDVDVNAIAAALAKESQSGGDVKKYNTRAQPTGNAAKTSTKKTTNGNAKKTPPATEKSASTSNSLTDLPPPPAATSSRKRQIPENSEESPVTTEAPLPPRRNKNKKKTPASASASAATSTTTDSSTDKKVSTSGNKDKADAKPKEATKSKASISSTSTTSGDEKTSKSTTSKEKRGPKQNSSGNSDSLASATSSAPAATTSSSA